eukprot:CAMPEP_0204824108 /NCGR_PEP_ID=MMETSP1346-20131115/2149_1 /ASSEMBLY_ACC=CAM_ASM_000771 /TAXON_ID=215587 /ORGANISM="Aplanochytrium stocchinoi, Strain GSBS06" /LENGTH=476 /DNA_ID=CAMNT_0051951073 /DNA_START=549 /DNA_END=1979 /DNA_ORIENTATION=+
MSAEISKKCLSCGDNLPRNKFSRNQWKKTHCQSRCTRCVLKEEMKNGLGGKPGGNATMSYFVPKSTVGKQIIRNKDATKLKKILQLTKSEYFGETSREIWEKEEIKEMIAKGCQVMVLKCQAPLMPEDQPTFETLKTEDISGFFTNRTNPISSISPRVGSVSGGENVEFLLDEDIGGDRGLEGALIELCKEKNRGIVIVIEVADTEAISDHQRVYYGTAVHASFHPYPHKEMFLEQLAAKTVEVLKTPEMLKLCSSLLSVTSCPTSSLTENISPNTIEQEGYKADRIVHISWEYPNCIPAKYKETKKWITDRESWGSVIAKILQGKRVEEYLQLYSKTKIIESLGYESGSDEYANIVSCIASTRSADFLATVQVRVANTDQSWMKVVILPREGMNKSSKNVNFNVVRPLRCTGCETPKVKNCKFRSCERCKNQFYCGKCWDTHEKIHTIKSISTNRTTSKAANAGKRIWALISSFQ